MPQPRHKAVIAGLAVTLTLGGVALPAVATTSEAPASDSDPNGMGDPAPADYDKSDYYEGAEGTVTFATARSASRLAPVALSDEMKYFTKYESGCDYDKGLSYGDGYNAMGYYQFDRRYALMPFIQQVYSYNSTKYAMLKAPLAQRDMLANPSYAMYDYVTRQLTAPAQILNEAWHAAYAADPAEFAALQDAYAYNNYYLPAQSMLLNSYGVDVRDRADCVKGLVWGMCNLFGQGGVQKFFDGANITNSMTDRELVTALCDTVIGRVGEWYPGQPQYHAGWQNRYKKEKAACLAYIDQHDAEQAAAGQQRPNDAPGMGDPGMGVPGPGEAPGAGAPTLGATPGTSAPGTGGGGAAAMPDGDAAPEPPAAQPNGPAAEPDAGRVPDAPVDEDSAPSAPESGPVDGSVNGEPTEDVDDGSNGVTPDSGLATGGTAPQGDSAPQSGSGLAQDPAAVGTDPVDQADAPATTDPATDEPVADPAVGDAAAAPVATGAPEKTPDATRNAAKKASSDAESTATPRAARASSGDLPDTGDIAAMVVTGAAGLAVAGTSFLSLAKKEREAR